MGMHCALTLQQLRLFRVDILPLGHHSQDTFSLRQLITFYHSRGFRSSSGSYIHKKHYANSRVCDVLDYWTKALRSADVPEPELSVQYIIGSIIGVTRASLPSHKYKVLSEEEMNILETKMECRMARMPVQYIVGEWEFYDLLLKLRPPVFIPRPETEELVKHALRYLESHPSATKVMEIGCGSGAISLALLKHWTKGSVTAIDRSKYALELTKENALLNNLTERLHLMLGKVTESSFPDVEQGVWDLVISNPPYVLRKDLLDVAPEIMLYEDLRALDGGRDGLDVIKPIIVNSERLLKPGCSLLMEIDPCHRYLIPMWMCRLKDMRLTAHKFYKDFRGKDRFVQITKE